MDSTDRPAPLALADGFTLKLCEDVGGWCYDDLPREVIAQLKRFLLDTLGVIGGAANAPGIAPLNARIARWEPGGSATALIGKRRHSPPSAAMANGAAAHALDYDDQHDPARVHTNCVVLPALLACAEERGNVGGGEFLLAYAMATELHARFGLACWNSLGKGWHPTMTLGALSAAFGAARMLRQQPEGIANAMGMAYHQLSGSAQAMRDGALAKRLGPGFAARAAVLGAFLAADGLSGTRRTLEGNAGLFALYERGEVRPDLLTGELGSRWRILEYSFKPYPCCRCNHTLIGIGIDLHRAGVRPEDIARIELRLGHVNFLTVGAAYDPARDDVVHAQFNANYAFARALLDGKVDLDSYRRPNLTDPRIAALTARSVAIDAPDIEPTAIEPAGVRLTLADGKVIERTETVMAGSPSRPMSEAEQMAKFHDCLQSGLGASRAECDRLAQTVMTIERARDVAAALVEAFPLARG